MLESSLVKSMLLWSLMGYPLLARSLISSGGKCLASTKLAKGVDLAQASVDGLFVVTEKASVGLLFGKSH